MEQNILLHSSMITRVDETGSLGPCSKLFFCQNDSPIPGVHLHSDFEMSSSKNLVGGPGFFVYFELDFCRLHRQ